MLPAIPRGPRSQAAQLPLRHRPRLRSDQLPQAVGGIVVAAAVVGVHLQHVLRPIRVVQHLRQGLGQAGATAVDEKTGAKASVGVTQPLMRSKIAGFSEMPSRAY